MSWAFEFTGTKQRVVQLVGELKGYPGQQDLEHLNTYKNIIIEEVLKFPESNQVTMTGSAQSGVCVRASGHSDGQYRYVNLEIKVAVI